MGLLDSLSYGNQGGYGGLLDALLYPTQAGRGVADPSVFTQGATADPMAGIANSSAMAPNALPFGLGAGAPPSQYGSMIPTTDPQMPSFASRFQPAADSPLPIQPMQIGGYQMPRIGQMADFTPQQMPQQNAILPQNAQPAQGQMPPTDVSAQSRQPMQQEQLPPALGGQPGGFLGGLSTGLQSIGNGGSLIGALTGNRTDPQSIAQQNLKAQYDATRQALIANGVHPSQASSTAMLSVMNPEAAKTILPEMLSGKEKYQVISEDPLAGKKYGFVNDRAQTVNGQPINAQGAGNGSAGSGSMDALQQAQQAGVTGPALYDHMPKGIAPVVRAMVEGRQPLPSTTAMRSPATLALIEAAHSVDPTFDVTTWKARNEAGPDWTKGKSAEMVRSANQTLAHVGSLMNAMDDLKNTRFPIANAIGNTVRENLGSGEQGAFRTNAHAVAEEMSKVFKGANLSDAEIKHWEQNLSENMSPAQQKAQIAKLSELLHGSLQALEEKRLSAMGQAQADKAGPLIKPEGQAVLKKIDDWVKNNGAAPTSNAAVTEGATATNPQTGAKITFKNGKWQ